MSERTEGSSQAKLSFVYTPVAGAGIACWLERRTRDRKVASSNPGRSGDRFFFYSRAVSYTHLTLPTRRTV